MNQRRFYDRFTTERTCILYLKANLDKGTVCCPKCGNKNMNWNEKLLHWRCKCMHRASVKSMTFMKDSNIPLLKWFEAIYIFVNTKKPSSDLEFSRKIGINRYKTVHYMLLKIRKQMSNKLNNIKFENVIEIDLNEFHTCKMFVKKSENRKTDSIKLQLPQHFLDQYSFLHSSNYSMRKVIITQFLKSSNLPPIKGYIHKWISLLKTNFMKIINGIHHFTTNFHLQLYLDEYSFKYNNRYRQNKFELFMDIDIDWQNSAQSIKKPPQPHSPPLKSAKTSA